MNSTATSTTTASTTGGIPSPALSSKSSHDYCNGETVLTGVSPSTATIAPVQRLHQHLQRPLNITEYANPSKGGMKKRCRTIMTPYQSRVLRRVLDHTAFPSTEVREQLAKMLGMKPRTVQIWFQNQRQKWRQSPGGPASPTTSMVTSSSPSQSSDGNLSDCSLSPTSSPDFSLAAANEAASAADSKLPFGLGAAGQLRFHGSVYKSSPGFNYSRGNTAASINLQRQSGNLLVPGFLQPPPQPQLIPMLQAVMKTQPAATIPNYATSASGTATGPLPLDLLASAVSNFRPNGYSYLPPNRLAPLSPTPTTECTTTTANSNAEKLPSLKALAQVAFELESTSSSTEISTRRPW